MPRWLFILLACCTALSVVGSVLIVLRSPGDRPAAPPADRPAAEAGARP